MDASTLNRMLEGRIKDLAGMKRGGSPDDLAARRKQLEMSLGLYPPPARTDPKGFVTGTVEGEGFRLEKLRFESRPGLLVTAHLYLPIGQGPWPAVVSAHGIWKGKKAAAVCQARGIAYALRGFATLIVDAPGTFGDDLSLDERAGVGVPGDPELIQGAPWIGVYAWDLIRALDVLQMRLDIDKDKVGITGDGDGGIAAACAFSLDERFQAGAFPCSLGSMEQGSLEALAQIGLPGFALAGDFSEMMTACCPRPICLMGAKLDQRHSSADVMRTAEKVRAHYSKQKLDGRVRFYVFEGGADYNRRMRETAMGFFTQFLIGGVEVDYLDELRPLTDGVQNAAVSGTARPEDGELLVTAPTDRGTITFRDLLAEAMAGPHPEMYKTTDRLVPWLKYGPHTQVESASELKLHDDTITQTVSGSIPIPASHVDFRLASLCGVGVCEMIAQVLHLMLPGRPEGWERQALGGDSLSAAIGSMLSLFQASSGDPVPKRIVAQGPAASLVAMYLRLYRDGLDISTSHTFSRWPDLAAQGMPALLQPGARYLQWPF